MAWSGEPLPEAGRGWRGAEFVGYVGAGVLTNHPPLEPGPEGNYHLILKGNYHITLKVDRTKGIIILLLKLSYISSSSSSSFVVVVRRSRRRDVKRNGDLGCSP